MSRPLGQQFLLPGAPAIVAQNSFGLQHLSPAAILQQSPFGQHVPLQSVLGFGQQVPPTHASVALQQVLPHRLSPAGHFGYWHAPLTHV
jgi:hypothetical protein